MKTIHWHYETGRGGEFFCVDASMINGHVFHVNWYDRGGNYWWADGLSDKAVRWSGLEVVDSKIVEHGSVL